MFTRILSVNSRWLFLALHLFASLIFTLHYLIVGNAVWGDGRYYYVYLRSAVIDQDLDFSNERLVDPFYFDFKPTPIGKVGNKYSIGPPLLWSPAYLLAHSASLTGHFLGLPISISGYGHVYRYSVGLLSVLYGTLSLRLTYKMLLDYFSQKLAVLTILASAIGTHVFYYYAIDPINSHLPSIFIASVLIFIWQRSISKSNLPNSTAFVLGLLTGILGMVRTHDLIFIIPLLWWAASNSPRLIGKLSKAITYISGVVIGFLPQLLVWQHLYGTITSPYLLGGESFDLTRANFLNVLASHNNGLLSYSPILLAAIAGLFLLSRQKNLLARYGLILLLFQIIVLGSWSGWWGGQSFGGRMFLSLTPIMVLGLAAGLNYLTPRLRLFTSILSILFTQSLALWYLLIN